MPDVRMCPSVSLTAMQLHSIRSLLDTAFEGGFTDDDWDHALGGMHAFVERDGVMVAHGSVVARRLTIGARHLAAGYVEAVAVLPELQGTGLGSAVMRCLAATMIGGFELGALATGEWPFYERLGWERWRGPTWVRLADGTLERSEGEDDSVMILRLPDSPTIDPAAPIICDTRPGDAW